MPVSRILKALLAGAALAALPLAVSAQEARTQPVDALYQNSGHTRQTDKSLFIWNFSRKPYKVTLDSAYPPNGTASSFSVDPTTLEEKNLQDFKGGESITIPPRRVLILKARKGTGDDKDYYVGELEVLYDTLN